MSETPKPIVTKISMGDYLGDPYAKFHHDTFTPLRPPNMPKCASIDSGSFCGTSTAYSQDPCTDFHDQYVKWRGFTQGCAFWGSQILHFDPIFSQKRNFWPIFDGTLKISRQKGHNNGGACL